MRKTLQRKILEALSKNPGISLKDLATLLYIDAAKLKLMLYKLKSTGYIERAGKGYVLTERGLKFLKYLEHAKSLILIEEEKSKVEEVKVVKPIEIQNTLVETKNKSESRVSLETPESKKPETTTYPTHSIVETMNNLIEKLQNIEKRVEILEQAIKNMEKTLTLLTKKKQEDLYVLDHPVMLFNEAVAKYGNLVERLLAENKAVRMGSLLVDLSFYEEFKSKFPIKLVDMEKLSQHEKLLLEEMRREAMVILHAGKEYKLVE